MAASCRIYFVSDHWVLEGARDWLGNLVTTLRSQNSQAAAVAETPDEASHILFLDGGRQRTRFWEPNYLAGHQLVRAHPHKCYIWNTEDRPVSYLPGLYVSMPRNFFDPRVHRAFRYMLLNTERLPVAAPRERDILYNFLGAPTAPVRRAILAGTHPSDALVLERLNFNHQRHAADEDVWYYADVLARSRFTLCPPGAATSSYRIFEAMRAGSVPVLISDELVLPQGPDWPSCSIRIREKDAQRVDEILSGVPNVEAMGNAAQAAFTRFFDSDKMLSHVARELTLLGPADQKTARRCFDWERWQRGWYKVMGKK